MTRVIPWVIILMFTYYGIDVIILLQSEIILSLWILSFKYKITVQE